MVGQKYLPPQGNTDILLQFKALGVNWTGTLLGCVAVVLMPIPLLFYLYGSRIRQKSKFAAEYTTVAKAHDDEE
jgi:DHA1 family multidrug resistance protein-like MFS transporter